MAENVPAVDREQMQRWMANWREVNEAQDEMVRAAPSPDPAASLEAGLSMIALALAMRGDESSLAETDRGPDVERIRGTWQRLRAAYAK
jgi:hypothetical protein